MSQYGDGWQAGAVGPETPRQQHAREREAHFADLATENATLRQENERLKEQNTRLAAYFSDHTAGETQPLLVLTVVKAHLAKDEATKTERDTLRSHLRDVVVPALEKACVIAHLVHKRTWEVCVAGDCPRFRTALHETQELLK